MLCPQCRSGRCRRSRRRSSVDFVVSSITGLRPWRCRTCATRFLAWSVAMVYLPYVHCRRCGNLDVQRVSRNHVEGWFVWVGRMLNLPAYRCAPCRNRFFSVLKHRRLRPIDEGIPETDEIEQPTSAAAR